MLIKGKTIQTLIGIVVAHLRAKKNNPKSEVLGCCKQAAKEKLNPWPSGG